MESGAPASSADVVDLPRELHGRTVDEVMLRSPTVFAPDAPVAELAAFFEDDHVHAALVVDPAGRLVAVVDPADLLDRSPHEPCGVVGRLGDRTTTAGADLALTWRTMRTGGRRRLAVVDPAGALQGLLCLKRSGRGFCSEHDAGERRRERLGTLAPG